MATLMTSTMKGRQPQAATLARSSRTAGWQVSLGSETLVPCRHEFIGRNLGIAKGLDSQYLPAGGSS
jgi:hypothetical protein